MPVSIQKQMVPTGELKSAFVGIAICAPLENCATPLRVTGVGAVSVTDASHVVP
jgi:hypothetical protein